MAELLEDFLREEYKPEAHIIGRGILPVGGKCIVAGSPKSNKSFLMLNLALDLVRGRRLFNATYPSGTPVFPVQKSWKVLYIEQEMGKQGLLERLSGKEGRPGLMSGIDPKGLQWTIQTRDTAMRLDTPEGRDFVGGILQSVKPDVTIFDPMAKFHLSNENDSQEIGAVMRVIDHFIENTGTAAIIVHHIGKQDPDPSRQKRGGDRLRGSSAIFADVDTLLEVTRLSTEHTMEPVLKLSFELRRGEPIEDIFVRRHRDGTIDWLGKDFTFETPNKESHWPKTKYRGF